MVLPARELYCCEVKRDLHAEYKIVERSIVELGEHVLVPAGPLMLLTGGKLIRSKLINDIIFAIFFSFAVLQLKQLIFEHLVVCLHL